MSSGCIHRGLYSLAYNAVMSTKETIVHTFIYIILRTGLVHCTVVCKLKGKIEFLEGSKNFKKIQ